MKLIKVNKEIKEIVIIEEEDTQIVADSIKQVLINDWEEISKYVIILSDREKFKIQFPEEICYYLNAIDEEGKRILNKKTESQKLLKENKKTKDKFIKMLKETTIGLQTNNLEWEREKEYLLNLFKRAIGIEKLEKRIDNRENMSIQRDDQLKEEIKKLKYNQENIMNIQLIKTFIEGKSEGKSELRKQLSSKELAWKWYNLGSIDAGSQEEGGSFPIKERNEEFEVRWQKRKL